MLRLRHDHLRHAHLRHARVAVPAISAVAMLMSGCSSSAPSATVKVAASSTGCVVDSASVAPGRIEFAATWSGDKTGEVYLYGKEADGFTKVLGEVEDLSSGLTKSFTAELASGEYEVACKNESNEAGIRTKLVVS